MVAQAHVTFRDSCRSWYTRAEPIGAAVSSSSKRLPVVQIQTIWAASWAVPAADEQTVLVQTSYGLVPIGWVQSVLRVLDDAPNQREGAPRAWIRFDEQVAEGAKDLRPGDEIVVLTWLHLSR